MYILSTSRTSILDLTITICRASCPLHFPMEPLGTPVAEKNHSLLVRDDERMKMCGKAFGVSWWMESLGRSRGQKPLGPAVIAQNIDYGGFPWAFMEDGVRKSLSLILDCRLRISCLICKLFTTLFAELHQLHRCVYKLVFVFAELRYLYVGWICQNMHVLLEVKCGYYKSTKGKKSGYLIIY